MSFQTGWATEGWWIASRIEAGARGLGQEGSTARGGEGPPLFNILVVSIRCDLVAVGRYGPRTLAQPWSWSLSFCGSTRSHRPIITYLGFAYELSHMYMTPSHVTKSQDTVVVPSK